jgi:hypothetical protein
MALRATPTMKTIVMLQWIVEWWKVSNCAKSQKISQGSGTVALAKTYDTKQDKSCTTDAAEKDRKPIEDLFSSAHIGGKSVDVAKPSFREHGEDVERRSATADADE